MTNVNKRANSGKLQVEELIEAYTSFINAFDGSSDAFATAEPIMETVFDPSYKFLADDGPKDLDWYRNFAQSFAAGQGNVAKVTSIEPTDTGLQVTIENTVAGVVIDPITYNGTTVVDENGKLRLSYFEPTDTNKSHQVKNVGKMIELAIESDAKKDVSRDSSVTFICKMAVSSDKIGDFQSQAQKAVEDMKSKEPGTRSFELYFSEDGSSFHTVERYDSSRAAAEHLRNMQKNKHRNAAIAMFGITMLEVYGAVSDDLKSVLRSEEYDVVYYESCGISLAQ